MSKMSLAPADGGAEATVEMVQTRYNTPRNCDDEDESVAYNQQVILPSNWRDRLGKDHKPSKVHQYSKIEILEYNEIQYIHGPKAAKEWADRRQRERNMG